MVSKKELRGVVSFSERRGEEKVVGSSKGNLNSEVLCVCMWEVSCEVFNFLQLRGYEKEGKLYLPTYLR